jgi:hypothetical protein
MPENEQTPEITVTQLPPDAGLDLLVDDSEDLLEEWSVPEAEDELLDVDDEVEDDEDEDDDEAAFDDIEGDPSFDALIGIAGQAGALMSAPSSETDERLRRLEAAARELAAAEVTRESRKVRRKVTASTTGAGAAGFIPILLQMTDVYSLKPEVAMAVAAGASLIGAFAAGWLTPERQPPLPNATAQQLLGLAEPPR